MTKAEEIMDRMLSGMIANNPDEFFTLEIMKAQPEYKTIIEVMQEYGKYCAEIALDDGFNLGFIDSKRPSFEDWWSAFQEKEAQERHVYFTIRELG